MLQKMFEDAIAKFPTSIPLRIQYILFLTTSMRSKTHALSEIVEAENFKCSIDEKFILFYIRRIIE
jgi:hypothetical protein